MNAANTTALRRLSELERQDRVLAHLPPKFEFPLFNGRQAVESQRRSGYQNTARAARELVDNAYEAGARKVHVIFERPGSDRADFERKNSVRSVAFIDDGPGMRPAMARLALSWGGGTRFEDPEGIGRFGFGLPNSSINQSKRVELYVKTKDDKSWSMCVLDINDLNQFGLVTVPLATTGELPVFVQEYLKRQKWGLDHGTVAVWKNADRLSYRIAEKLREHMVNDFGVVYRYLLDEFELVVEGQRVEKTDPLFLMPDARLFRAEKDGGAISMLDQTVPVRYRHDPRTGDHHLERINDLAELKKNEPGSEWVFSTIRVRIARFPFGFASVYKEHGEEANARLEVRKPRRGISFVRARREIDTMDVLPKEPGNFPQLQAYANHWGVEVTFAPDLDDVFGVQSDKQGVRPLQDFWELMVKDLELDAKMQAENAYQRGIRDEDEQKRRKAKLEEQSKAGVASPAELAAAAASKVLGPKRNPSAAEQKESEQRENERAASKAKETGKSDAEIRKAIQAEQARRPFAVEFFSAKGMPFLVPDIGAGYQRVARINEAHRFFKEFYAPLMDLPDGGRSRLAVDLILLALVDSELRASDEPADGLVPKTHLEDVREHGWSRFLDVGFDVLSKIDRATGEEPDEHPDAPDSAKRSGASAATTGAAAS